MKWTVLADNRTKDPALETEHGLSIFLETGKYHILLDTGASEMLIRNARRLEVDLSTVDYVFISHGHCDHAGAIINSTQIVSAYIASQRYGQRYQKIGCLQSMIIAALTMTCILLLIFPKDAQCQWGINIFLY